MPGDFTPHGEVAGYWHLTARCPYGHFQSIPIDNDGTVLLPLRCPTCVELESLSPGPITRLLTRRRFRKQLKEL